MAPWWFSIVWLFFCPLVVLGAFACFGYLLRFFGISDEHSVSSRCRNSEDFLPSVVEGMAEACAADVLRAVLIALAFAAGAAIAITTDDQAWLLPWGWKIGLTVATPLVYSTLIWRAVR